MKRVAKAITLFIASTTYLLLLFLTATTTATFLAFKDSTTIKTWLVKSGAYTSVVEEVSNLATIQQKQENSLVQITHEDIKESAVQSFSPESMRTDAESVIDGFYDWFKGETTGPEFTVDFSSRQTLFAGVMTDKLENKINELPECENSGRFTVQAFDPFKAECRPKGVDLTQELTSFEKEIANSTDILPKVKYTGDDVVIHDDNGEPQRVATALPWVPKAYRALLYGPWVALALTVLSALVMVFMSTSRRKGLRRFAGGLFFAGIILIISGLFLRPAFERLNAWSSKGLGAQASLTQNVVDPMFREINTTFARYSLIFGISYMIPSLLTYGMLIITRSKKVEEHHVQHIAEDTEPEPQTQPVAVLEQPVAPMEQPPIVSEPIASVEIPTEPNSPPANQPVVDNPVPSEQPVVEVKKRPPMIQG